MSINQFDAHLFINGVWVEGRAGRQKNIDPASSQTLGEVSLADERQVQDAIDAANEAFKMWSAKLPLERGAFLKKVASILRMKAPEISKALLLESGKTFADATGEVNRAIETFEWNGEEAARIFGKTYTGVSSGSQRQSLPVPLGVAVAITPWNFPVVLVARKIGAALAAGCTVVLKASEFTPVSVKIVIEVLQEAGLPDGVVNLIYGDPVKISKQLLSDKCVKVVSFTGSTTVGKALAALAAPNLIRPIFELGGHAPVIVWSDADIEKVISVTAPAKFGSAGQSCVAPTRYIVHHSLHDRLVQGLVLKAKSYQLGHGLEEGTTMGAVAHGGRIKELKSLVDDAVAKGAVVETGGRQADRVGFFFEPTILSRVSVDANILSEEPFGPIASVQSFTSIDDALNMANSGDYSFAAYVFTDSITVRNKIISGLNASNIGVNQTAPSLPDVPLGGLGNSGCGYEGGTEGVLAYTQSRLISHSPL